MNSLGFIFRRGSTWPDVLAVVAVVGVLTGITVPMMLSARLHASRARCTDNLREIGQAMTAYAANNHGRLPSTRPSHGDIVIPDVTNSGFGPGDSLADEGRPVPNNVPAAMFLLVRTGLLDPSAFICPGTAGQPDRLDLHPANARWNFADVNLNLSYAMHNPYASDVLAATGWEWRLKSDSTFVLVADRGPDCRFLKEASEDSGSDRKRMGNSANHDRHGQNVLYADGRVEFRSDPYAGANGDHIYLTRSGHTLDSACDPDDTIVLPLE